MSQSGNNDQPGADSEMDEIGAGNASPEEEEANVEPSSHKMFISNVQDRESAIAIFNF